MIIGYKCEPGKCLYFSLEDNLYRLKKRLGISCHKLGIDPKTSNGYVNFKLAVPRLGQGFEGRIRDWMTEHPDTQLIFVDILSEVCQEKKRSDSIYLDDYKIGKTVRASAIKKPYKSSETG